RYAGARCTMSKGAHSGHAKAVLQSHLRDFTADSRMLLLSGLALVIGCSGAALAFLLLPLIYAATNIFYFHRLSWQFVSPATNRLHWLAVFVPIVGGVILCGMGRLRC